MRVIVRSKEANFWLPVPLSLARAAVRLVPESALAQARIAVPAPYDMLLTKPFLGALVGECVTVLKEYKGLELVHVEAADGTFVSIRL